LGGGGGRLKLEHFLTRSLPCPLPHLRDFQLVELFKQSEMFLI